MYSKLVNSNSRYRHDGGQQVNFRDRAQRNVFICPLFYFILLCLKLTAASIQHHTACLQYTIHSTLLSSVYYSIILACILRGCVITPDVFIVHSGNLLQIALSFHMESRLTFVVRKQRAKGFFRN